MLERQAAAEIDQRARIENIWLRRPVTTILVTALLCTAALTKAQKVFFDYNLLNMQSAGLGAVIFQDKLIQSSARSVLYGAVMATNLTDAISLETRLKNLPAVASIDSMTPFLTEDHTPKLKLLGEIKAALAEVRFAPVDASLVNVSNLNQTLFGLHGYLTDAVGEAKKEDPKLGAQLALLRTAVGDLLNEMRKSDKETAGRKLAAFQQAMLYDVRETFRVLQTQDDRGGLQVEDLPASLRNRFVGVNGTFLLQVYPKEDVWQRDKQENFVKQLRIVDPNVTGTPVQLLEYTSLLKSSFEEAALYSLCAIVVLVFLHFHRVSCVLMSLLPVGIGTLWMVGIMGATGVPFNPANIMTLPLIIGVGVTNGIHILNRFAEEQHPSILAKSTGKAVLVSGLTTIAGFGSLALAKHRGIQSLGIIMAVGTATCMIAGLTVLPAILNLLGRRGWTLKKTQRDNAQSPLGREEPR